MIKTGRFIAELRREKGLTQQALAGQLFVTAKTVSRWENGNYAPPIIRNFSVTSFFALS